MKKGLIAICGSKRAGKSTAAKIFKTMLEEQLVELSLASHIKNTSAKVFQMDMKYFEDQKYKEKELEDYLELTPVRVREILEAFSFKIDDLSQVDQVRCHYGKVFETPRKLLQYVGTEMINNIEKTRHCQIMSEKLDLTKINVCSDLRFLHEINFFKGQDFEFKTLCISSHEAETIAKGDLHPSEQEFFKFKDTCDFTIKNDGTLENYIASLQEFVRKVLL